ncbi:MAG TPA: tetratricopeptide repeat protein [Anaeromyxobacteraceae bacterium]|nr:tetratricopeptide repeat protein [Anaeromyxobacteraceae bacterium]
MIDTGDEKGGAGAADGVVGFEEGMARFRAGDAVGAHELFERAHRRTPGDPRVMSWYGVTLVLVERNSNLGVLYCDQALRLAGPEPELLLNQARAHLALGQRERAVKAIQRGLAAAPEDARLKAAQESMGWRRRPVFPCFGRSNPLNRWLGRLRHRWSRRIHPVPAPTPMSLGLLPEAAPPDGERRSA